MLTARTVASYPIGNSIITQAYTLAVSNDFETTYNGWVSTGNTVQVVVSDTNVIWVYE